MHTSLQEPVTHGTAIFPLQVYSHRDRNGFYQVSAHWHDELEWIYVEEGTLSITAHGACFSLSAGEFCFMNAGEVHAISAVGSSLHHAVVFHPSMLDFALYDACQHNFIQPVTSGHLRFPAMSASIADPSAQAYILSCLKQITRLYHSLPRCSLLSIKLLLLQVLETLFIQDALEENVQAEKERSSIDRLKHVIDYIKENLSQTIALEQLSSLAHMSPTYFCHYFKRQTGKTPVQFINEHRIQHAAKLLTETEQSVSEIALACGFDNFSYFTRKFREYQHVTPRQYRAEYARR
ncbi:MAG: helix-turn-helix transcriptional regulator [Clostridiales bacterium]|nr:helix-turn-helix transcriptional regulator [Clostridiales bacterium]